jgi:hypothetical protein
MHHFLAPRIYEGAKGGVAANSTINPNLHLFRVYNVKSCGLF